MLKVLDTDPDVLAYPGKTLSVVPATGVVGSVTTVTRNARREADAAFCEKHFANHVLFSSVPEVLSRLGGVKMVKKLEALELQARDSRLLSSLTKQLRDCYAHESDKKPAFAEQSIGETYWLDKLADVCVPSKEDSLSS